MGRSSSKLMETPNNPLQELQYKECKREQRKRNQEKELKQIAKLQKKYDKKNKQKKKKANSGNSQQEPQHQQPSKNSLLTKRNSGSISTPKLGSFSYNNAKYELNTDEFNKQKETKLQQNLKSDLNAFLINQIVLSQQFFKNYDR